MAAAQVWPLSALQVRGKDAVAHVLAMYLRMLNVEFESSVSIVPVAKRPTRPWSGATPTQLEKMIDDTDHLLFIFARTRSLERLRVTLAETRRDIPLSPPNEPVRRYFACVEEALDTVMARG